MKEEKLKEEHVLLALELMRDFEAMERLGDLLLNFIFNIFYTNYLHVLSFNTSL